MLPKEQVEYLKQSFYGWEYCVEHNLAPAMTKEEIVLLNNVFFDLEDLKIENRELKRKVNKIHEIYGDI